MGKTFILILLDFQNCDCVFLRGYSGGDEFPVRAAGFDDVFPLPVQGSEVALLL